MSNWPNSGIFVWKIQNPYSILSFQNLTHFIHCVLLKKLITFDVKNFHCSKHLNFPPKSSPVVMVSKTQIVIISELFIPWPKKCITLGVKNFQCLKDLNFPPKSGIGIISELLNPWPKKIITFDVKFFHCLYLRNRSSYRTLPPQNLG